MTEKSDKKACQINRLFEVLSVTKNPEELSRLMIDLCSPAELEAMAERWRVVEPVMEGKSYRQIHEETGVSVTTVGRVARTVSRGSGGYALIYGRLKDNEKKQ